MRRLAWVLMALVAAAALAPPEAEARAVRTTRRRGKRAHRFSGKLVGHGVRDAELRAAPLPRPSGRVAVHFPAIDASVDVNIFAARGGYDQDALARLDAVFRCRRTGETRALDPRLFEILSLIGDRFGETIQVTSGFRNQQNEASRHFHGSAVDISIPGVETNDLYAFAATLDAGGMGIGRYPKSKFVHIDFRAPGEPSYRWTDTRGQRRGKATPKTRRTSAATRSSGMRARST